MLKEEQETVLERFYAFIYWSNVGRVICKENVN